MPDIEEFKKKHQVWKQCLSGEDRNAIHTQINWMLWNTAVFRSINEAVRLAPRAPEGGVTLNGALHELIIRGFFCDQIVTIRRLVDGTSDWDNPN